MNEIGYFGPKSISEACRLLAKYGDEARAIAGGTVLVLLMNKRISRPGYLIDLATIPNLEFIKFSDTAVRLGALVSHRAIEKSALIREKYLILSEMAHTIANPQIRNMGTLGGCLAYGEAACDPPAALISLGAKVKIASSGGERVLPVEDLITGFYETCLKQDELIVECAIPSAAPRTGAAYRRYSSTVMEDKPILGVAARLILDSHERCYDIRLGLGAIASTPIRPRKAEELMKGKKISDDLIDETAERAVADVDFIDDIKASAEYRKAMTIECLRQTIREAYQRARSSQTT